MCVIYEIKEHLATEPGCDISVAFRMARRLAMLGADMLLGGGTEILSLRVNRGSRTAAYRGFEVTPALKDAISLILDMDDDDAGCLVLDLEYRYRWFSDDAAFCDGLGPSPFCEMLDTLSIEQLGKFCYVLWQNAEGSGTMGKIVLYGLNGAGEVKRGESPAYIQTDTLPAGAHWYTRSVSLSYEGPALPGLTDALRTLGISGGNPQPDKGLPFILEGETCTLPPDLCVNGNELDYHPFTYSFGTPEAVHGFAEQMVTVLRLAKMTEYEEEFLDANAPLPRMLRLYVNANGTVRFALAES